MTFKKLLKRYGSEEAIAKAFGVTRQAVQKWRDKNKVPLLRQYQLRDKLRGAVDSL